MPQGPIQVAAAVKPVDNTFAASKGAPLQADLSGTLLAGKGLKNVLNRTATAGVIIKAAPGRIGKVIVNTVDSTASGIYDCATTGAIAAGTLVFAIPKTVGIYDVDFPCNAGIAMVVGTAGVMSISFA